MIPHLVLHTDHEFSWVIPELRLLLAVRMADIYQEFVG
jgi:hypothetical protein